MSLAEPGRLYRLLPALYRLRDAERGEPLRALLALLEGEFDLVEGAIAGQYDDWFIETCAEWVLPYIGDLLGVRPSHPVAGAGVGTRALVANTLGYRRRKGTALVLEQVARDTSGWPAHAVECFATLATTQHTNHVRLRPAATAGLREGAVAGLVDGAFDPFAHTLEVRGAASRGGRYNIPNLGLFVWRLRSYRVGAGAPGDSAPDFASAREAGAWWSIHPAGVDSPLFNLARAPAGSGRAAGEENLPGALRAAALGAELARLRADPASAAPRFLAAADPALRVWVRRAGDPALVEVARADMYLCALPDPAPPGALAFDPARGRLGFAPPPAPAVEQVLVQSSYGFAGDLGGGPYDRGDAVRAANRFAARGQSLATDRSGFFDPGVWQAGVSHLEADDGSGQLFGSLRAALAAWQAQTVAHTGVIVLMDSLSDDDPGTPPAPLEAVVGAGAHLLVVAGEWPREPAPDGSGASVRVPGRFAAQRSRAHLVGDLVVRGGAGPAADDPGECIINGLLLDGQLRVGPGNLGRLALDHSTLVPGRGGLLVEAGGGDRLQLSLSRSICGGVVLAGPIGALEIADCIVEAPPPVAPPPAAPPAALAAAGTDATLVRSTFLGAVEVRAVEASDCIFAAPLQVRRRQAGCVRFSYLAPGSVAPRRYRCQPDLELAARHAAPPAAGEALLRDQVEAQLKPLFTARRYGQPGYGQLARRCPAALRTGAESGAEMGAFEFLQQPQREANLRQALAEYLPFGLEAAVLFVT
jgi:hypothetical protein